MKDILYKFLSLFSIIRIYNILVIITAQYLTAIFIISLEKSFESVLFDFNLFLLIICSSIAIGSGYIINNFYDYEKDLINKPVKSEIDKIIRKRTKLRLYILLNFLCISISYYVSFKSVLFFSIYIFCIWLYSHRLKKRLIIGNLFSSILSIIPFLVILIYYRNFDLIIFVYALFLLIIVYIRELTKDLENLTGDFTLNYKTIPVVFGEKICKYIITGCITFSYLVIYMLLTKFDTGVMYYYYYFSIIFLFLFNLKLFKSSSKKDYGQLHLLLKILIFLGVTSIVLIKPSIFLEKLYLLLN